MKTFLSLPPLHLIMKNKAIEGSISALENLTGEDANILSAVNEMLERNYIDNRISMVSGSKSALAVWIRKTVTT